MTIGSMTEGFVILQWILRELGVHQFAPANWITRLFVRLACDANMRELDLCENILFLLVGFDKAQTNKVSRNKCTQSRSLSIENLFY